MITSNPTWSIIYVPQPPNIDLDLERAVVCVRCIKHPFSVFPSSIEKQNDEPAEDFDVADAADDEIWETFSPDQVQGLDRAMRVRRKQCWLACEREGGRGGRREIERYNRDVRGVRRKFRNGIVDLC